MSLQLILYPQSYNGIYSVISTPVYNQYVPDHEFNSGFFQYNWGTSGNFGGHQSPYEEVTANITPSQSWSAYYVGATGLAITTPQPDMDGNKCCLFSTDTTAEGSEYGWSGIFIVVDGLTVGHDYDQQVDISGASGTSGILLTGSSLGSWSTAGGIMHSLPQNLIWFGGAAPNGINTSTFTATDTTMVFSLHYGNIDGTGLCIESVSITESPDNPQLITTTSDGQVICDLYTDESIPLTLSIDNFKNVAEKTQSYSKAFSLPTTKKNNKIFTELYDVTKSVEADGFAFNPHKKTKALLKEDGYTLFDGFLKLIDINETEGETSYNVNLYSDIVSLKDTLGTKKIKDLNNGFNELAHDYHKSNIKNSWDGNLPVSALAAGSFAGAAGATVTDVLKYPFCNYHGNISLVANKVTLDKLEDAFRPWLRCKYLVDRIINEAGFTYSSTFLNSSDFTRLFMDFNWGADNAPTYHAGSSAFLNISTSGYVVVAANGSSWGNARVNSPSTVTLTHWDKPNNRYTAQQNNTNVDFTFQLSVYLSVAGDISRQVKVTRAATGAVEYPITVAPIARTAYQMLTWNNTISVSLDANDTVEFQFLATGGGDLVASQWGMDMLVTTSIASITTSNLMNTLRGELKQWDFFKGLMDMFNLMVMRDKDDPTKLVIEPYKNIFIENANIEVHDWTDKVDATETNLQPIELTKKLIFKYTDDQKDYGTLQYASATASNYGEAIVDASSFTMLEGETKIEAKPFAATFIKPIFDTVPPEFTIPIMYEVKADGTSAGLKNKPRILYDVSADLNVHGARDLGAGNEYYIPNQAGLSSENQQRFGQFAHVTDIPTVAGTSKDYNFGASQLISTIGTAPIDNLFNVYWAPYYDELYNSDTKTLTLKVFLTPADMTNFNFYDKVRIKNREYRVNKIDYTAGELSKVEFILI